MKIDFTTPNAKAVSQMDAFFQDGNHSSKADRIGDRYYEGDNGWDAVPESKIAGAFYEFMALKTNTNTSDEEIENY